MKLWQDELIHLSLSLSTGLILFLIFDSFWFLFFSLLLGFFIDGDHLIDYFYYFFRLEKKTTKKNIFNFAFHLKKFFQPAFYILKTQKIIVFFHGWEYILLFFLVLKIIGSGLSCPGLELTIIAYILHLGWDQHSSAGSYRSYFFLYRLKNQFSYQAYTRR